MKKTIFAALLVATVLLVGCESGAANPGGSIIGVDESTDGVSNTDGQTEESDAIYDDITSNPPATIAPESTAPPAEDITVPPEVSEPETTVPPTVDTPAPAPETTEQPNETLPSEIPDDTGSLPVPTVRNMILTKKTLNADGTAKLMVSVEGDVNFYGLEFRMKITPAPEKVDITIHADGAAANYTSGREVVFSFVSPSASDVTQSITLFSMILPSADVETEIFGIDIFNDKFADENYTVY